MTSNTSANDVPVIFYGNVDKNGKITNGKGFSCHRESTGTYRLTFNPQFSEVPAIVGSQTGFGNTNESTLDQVTFPFVYKDSCTVLTGGSGGNLEDRSFSIIVVGPQ